MSAYKLSHLLEVPHGPADHLGRQVEATGKFILLHPLKLSQGCEQDDAQAGGVLLQQQQHTKTTLSNPGDEKAVSPASVNPRRELLKMLAGPGIS